VHLLWEQFRLFPDPWVGRAVGWPLVVAETPLVAWAQRTMLGAGKSSNVYKSTGAIVSTGTYAFTRTAMYLSITLLYVGVALIVNTLWPGILLPALLMVIQYGVILREEGYLERKFGDEYLSYRAKVRHWL